LLIFSPTFFFPLIFQSLGRSIDEPSDAAVQSDDQTGTAPVDAVEAQVIEGKPGSI
jgi:hypothetical protein